MSAVEREKSTLLQNIIQFGELAYNPDLPSSERSQNVAKLSEFLESTATSKLMPALTTLVQPGRVQPWLRPHLIQSLSVLPLRPRGVRQTIEFVLSIHPSTIHHAENSTSSQPQSRGPTISLDALNSASRLISSPPSNFSSQKWFEAIAPQLLGLLDGQGGLEMVKTAAYIIGYGVLGRREYGAPGTPGWNAFAKPIIGCIDPSLRNGRSISTPDVSPSVLKVTNIISTSAELAEALRRLASLLSSHPNPGLSKRLLTNLLLPLWALASWTEEDGAQEDWRAPAQYLLQIFLQLSDSSKLLFIADNLMYEGSRDDNRICWTYKLAPEGGIQVEKWMSSEGIFSSSQSLDLIVIDRKIDAFINILEPVRGADDVSSIFVTLSQRWMLGEKEPRRKEVLISAAQEDSDKDYEKRIIDAKIMQKMIDKFPDRLVSDSSQVLDLAAKVLSAITRSGDDAESDDTVPVALSLLNMVFTSSNFQSSTLNPTTLNDITTSLRSLAHVNESSISSTSRNLLRLLQYQDSESATSLEPSLGKDDEDRRIYKLALSYLTATDSPPPVRAQGLDLYSGLIASSSSILDIPATLILLSSLLQDEEEYIYLRAIKTFILLSNKHPRAVLQSLIEQYIDANEEASLDARLRTGEALLQVVERAGDTFTGEIARQVGERLLWIGGRRGYRPKTESRQKKAAAASKNKVAAAEEAWDGPVPLLEDEKDKTADDEIMEGIVQGWESKRGQEDVRIRASALSIFGCAIETNVAGLGSSIISAAIDLCVNTLAIETENEKIILRRAAILLVMSLVRALDKARDEGRKLGFGLAGQSLEDVLRILKYVEETDNDALVREHAKDVIEGLNDWQLKGLLGERTVAQTGIERLAGLSVNPDISLSRPRIEEIE